MTSIIPAPADLSDAELLIAVGQAAAGERLATADLIELLTELDTRRLYLGEGYSSLFTYCTQHLHLSEHVAYARIETARCARRFPIVLDLLREGALTLTAIGLLAPHLTPDNVQGVLAAARHQSKRHVEHLVGTLRPEPDVPSTIRKLPPCGQPARRTVSSDEKRQGRSPVSEAGQRAICLSGLLDEVTPANRQSHRTTVTPLAAERYKLQLTMSRETHDKLRRAQDLLRHVIPNGDPAAILARALTVLVADLERARLAATEHPQRARAATPGSRHVPAAIRRQVWSRDMNQCAFVGARGRCTERGFLEIHHVVPYALGGPTELANLELRCRQHNIHEADRVFGPLFSRETRPSYERVWRSQDPLAHGCAGISTRSRGRRSR